MNWAKKNAYYIENNEWTICKTGEGDNIKYGLWKYAKYRLWENANNYGWFNTSKEAIERWKELND